MADCRGQAFAERGEASCQFVRELCGYGVCTDSTGDHCYGIDTALNYSAGQFEPAGNGSCSQARTYCPAARNEYYVPDVNGINICCSKPDQMMYCPNAFCACYDLNQLPSLTPLAQNAQASSTPVARSSSSSIPSSSSLITSFSSASQTLSSTSALSSSTQGVAPPSNSSSSSSLSTGAIVGIVLGSVFAVGAIINIAFLLISRSRRRRRNEAEKAAGVSVEGKRDSDSLMKSYTGGGSHEVYVHPVEAPGVEPKYEAGGRQVVPEVGGGQGLQEAGGRQLTAEEAARAGSLTSRGSGNARSQGFP